MSEGTLGASIFPEAQRGKKFQPSVRQAVSFMGFRCSEIAIQNGNLFHFQKHRAAMFRKIIAAHFLRSFRRTPNLNERTKNIIRELL
ncbi:MAG TPA: hypothetical protein VFW05_15125 [Verrucomicrobiae bacterium]|nr:hypothetical protein [Verrucomicrobiae bacterium]